MTFNFVNELTAFINQSEIYLKPWSIVIGIIWCINIFNWVIGSKLNYYFGIYPRNLFGLIGIPISPLLHQNFTHLFFNTIPLFVLGLALLASEGTLNFCWITLVIVVLGGLAVWLVARKAMHIGASGLISGYFGFIMISAYKAPGLITILLAVVAAYYFGGIFLGLFPGKKTISWESHLFGFLAGIACAYIPNMLSYFIH
jgi:membrane associated rhomboid family serine protease